MKNNCSLNASLSTFRDPCPGYSKYLQVAYTCTPEHNLTTCGKNINITCPPYTEAGNFPTVVEVRSVFYGRITTSVCPSGATGTNCSPLDTSRKSIMKICQGRNQCAIDDLTKYLQDPCVNNTKYFNMTYTCQPVYKFAGVENRPLVPNNLTCYDNMVIVPHKAMWLNSKCAEQPDTFKKVKKWCDVKKLAMKTSTFNIVLRELLNLEWTMELGTNVTAVFVWGDKANNTILHGQQANATSHLKQLTAHNYTEQGAYNITIMADNVLNNQTVSGKARGTYAFVVGASSKMTLLWTNGSHLLVHIGSNAGISTWMYVTLKNDSIGGVVIEHVFPKVIAEIPLQNLNVSVTCKRRFKDCFEDGVYTMRFNGTNGLLNEFATSPIAITQHPCRIINVSIDNIAVTMSAATRVLRSLSFVIRSKYSIRCDDATGAVLEWDIQRREGHDFVRHQTIATTTSYLIVQPLSLEYGAYKIKLTLTLKGVEGVFQFSSGYFEVTKTPLVAVMLQGSGIRRAENEPISLDGSKSRDPDKANSTLQYKWFCRDIPYKDIDLAVIPLTSLACANGTCDNVTQSCGRYRSSLLGNAAKAIVLVPELLAGISTVLVQLEIQEGNRIARASTVIQRVNDTVPSLEIRCKENCKEKKIIDEILSYVGECTKHCPRQIMVEWSLFKHIKSTDLKDILYVASDPEASVQLPAGHPDRSMVLELSVTVQDYNGLQTSVNVPTTVQPRKINSSEVTRLILANNSKLDFYIQSGDINAASELVSGFVSILNYEATMNSTYSQIMHRRQVVASNKTNMMAKFLVQKSLEDVGVSVIKDTCKDLMTAISNIMSSAAYTAEYGKGNITLVDQQKSQGVVNDNMNTLDYSIRAVFNKKVEGEEDTIIQTTTTGLACRRTDPKLVGGRPLVIKDGQVAFPRADILLNDTNTTYIDIHMLLIPDNPYTWDKTSPRIKSSIVKLGIKDDAHQTLKIENLAEDIEFVISDVEEPVLDNPPQYYKNADNSTMQYHSITHTEEGGSIRLGIRPVNGSDFFAAYIKYAARPTKTDYDMKATFPNYTTCVFDRNGIPVNCSQDPHQLYIPSEFLQRKGEYFVGITLEEPTRHEEAKSRQRRDCEPGRRVKRSCVKYKDPPSPLPGNGAYQAFRRAFSYYY
ncbi:hypothetical protein QZH41_006576 [Actinostola sp. cb2023]|nr:hypothetical protein QZH41_006576 [Actinostola sp. cb2023]